MERNNYALVAIVLAALLLPFSSCKKDTPNFRESSPVQSSLNNLNGFSDPLVVSLYAGNPNSEIGNTDGPRLTAKFAEPYGITVTSTGFLYITDVANDNIRKISPDGNVSTIPIKRHGPPFAITTGNDGFVYFIEGSEHQIRRITPDDQIQAPLETCKLGTDGVRTPFVFSSLFDLAVAADGTIYLVDAGSHSIIKRTPNGIGTVFAGGTQGYKDGKGTEAEFNTPTSIAIDANNNLYVGDLLNSRVRKITPDGTVTTVAGSTPGYNDGIGSNAQFRGMQDIVVADSTTLLISELYNVRRIDLKTDQVTTIAGGPTAGFTNGGPALSARFGSLSLLTTYNNAIYVVERGTHRILKISPQ